MRIETSKGWVEIRELHGLEEMLAAENIQKLVWGWDSIPHPKEILIPIQHEGGLLAGAFAADNQLVSLIFGFPTRDPAWQHSQLLATLEDWRGLGIGARLKWFQRSWCLERGIQHVRWTVDPLRAANAELNFRHLGGISSTYYPDYYGVMQGIDAGAPTDRLLVEWHLSSARVAARAAQLEERPREDRGFPQAQPANEIEESRPAAARTGLNSAQILIRFPENFIKIANANPELALAWRMQTRDLFLDYFAGGYAITEFTRLDGPAYLLEIRSEHAEG